MDSYRTILKRVGLVLIGIGTIDIAYMVHLLLQGQRYSSWFNIFAVVAGVFLLRGNLRAIHIITWVAAFMFAHLVSNLAILLPFVKPAELWAIEFRLDPVGLALSLLIRIMAIALLFWVYTQLRTAPVVAASARTGNSATTPKLAFVLGVTLVAIPVGILHITRGSAAGNKAVEIAQTQYGEDYKYHITAMSWSDGQVRASLTAYNAQEIKPVQVEWQQ
ncbi:MAG: hypothetical protein AAFV46_08475 [Cyanobacteria bacterium J06635_11]